MNGEDNFGWVDMESFLGEGTFELRPEKEPIRERTPKECAMLNRKRVQRP